MKTKKILLISSVCFVLFFTIALVIARVLPWLQFKKYSPQEGDLIFQSLPQNDLVLAIEGISESPYSHCGIVTSKNNEWMVLEAIGPVKYTPLYEWVRRGRKEAFSVYRLNDQTKIAEFIKEAEAFLGKPYDVRYRLDDEKIYCSELIYKAYYKAAKIYLGNLKALGDMPWQNYTATIRKYEQGPPPLKRLMITPANLAKAKELKQIYSQEF